MDRSRQICWLAVLLATPWSAAVADEIPQRKAGLWETTTQVGGRSVTMRQCVGTTDPLLKSAAQSLAGAACSKQTVTKTADGYEGEYSCKLGPISIEGKTVVTGDLNSEFKVESTSLMKGMPGRPNPTPRSTSIVSRLVGPCEAGQKPGDMILPDGRVMHMPSFGQ